MAIIYRMATQADIDDLVVFWSNNTGWDNIDRTEWERRFYNTPYGASDVAIAIDEKSGGIQGQIVFIPTAITVDGKEIKARRPYALVIHKSLRSALRFLALLDVVTRMYKCATKNFKSQGVGLIHMMPDPGWVKAFKLLSNAQTGSFPLWSLSLPLQNAFALPVDYEVKAITPTDEQINLLCEANSRLYGCSFPRNTKTLPWKTSHGNYKLLGLFYKGTMVGLSASLAKEKDKQWLICDVLSADSGPSLTLILKATCNVANDFLSAGQTAVQKVAILVTPLLEKRVAELGFQKDNYAFPIVVQRLDLSIARDRVAPERWYASAND